MGLLTTEQPARHCGTTHATLEIHQNLCPCTLNSRPPKFPRFFLVFLKILDEPRTDNMYLIYHIGTGSQTRHGPPCGPWPNRIVLVRTATLNAKMHYAARELKSGLQPRME